ncbi:hypothetical protein SLEP1_g7191 [Rubroshorea leprosula]|uniref:Uncharacterized protein n=1 Tax=Rubroshorea leprosula TaxID=152421 RepID=A0AAV5I7D9_9ROSI|nr:hypothetical protein SLEP1_g7191 [Rubroshorea leprosula]
MRVLFDYHELLSVVENGVAEIAENANDAQKHAYRESKKKDKKALYFIHQGVNDEVFEKIEDAATSKQAWDTLMTAYKGAEKVKKVKLQTLRRQYELLQMEFSELVATYINRVLALTNKSKVYGEEYSEQAKVEKILRIVVAIEEAHDLSQMTVDELSGDQGGETSQKHGGSRGRGRGRGFYFNKGRGVGGNDQGKSNFGYQQNSRGHGRGRGRYDKSNVECYNCHKYGHYSSECRYKDNTQKAHFVQGDDDADSSHALLMVTAVGETPNFHTWFLDTGCTNHMSGKRELFADLDESFRTKVKFADDRTIPITGKGRILINLKNGDHKYISDVFYVPGMKSNLLSVGQLLEKGYVMSLRDDQFSILDEQEQGIKHEITFPYTPQHNGVAERKNRTIMDMTRSLLKAKGMPNSFWGEAVSCSVYLLNRSPTRSVQNITPVEAWSGFKPSVKHLKVFGSVAYAHIPAETRTKLDDRAEKIVFIGYKRGGYKLFNLDTKKVIVSRDVTFAEEEAWKWDVDTHKVDDEVDDDGELVHFAFFVDSEPVTFEEAIQDPRWVNAMNEEIKAIERNNTWVLTDIPQAHKAIDVKWVFKTKVKSNGEVERYKARLVAKGFEQRLGYDFQEVFSPAARMETIKLIVGLAAQNQWKIHQMDVKSAFLNGPLEEEVYVKQPLGFMKQGSEDKVYRLKKALYGLEQAPRAWNKHVDSLFLQVGFEKCPSEHALYVKVNNSGDILLLCLYVDDLIFTGNNPTMIEDFKKSMMGEFEMIDLGLMSYFLGMEVVQRKDGIFICQKRYAIELLKKFHMQNCNCVRTPMEVGTRLSKNGEGAPVDSTYFKQIVGSLRYLTCTRPDISYGVGLISRFLENLQQSHMQVAKKIMRYLKGTLNYGLFYSSTDNCAIIGYLDSDWVGDLDDRKSTSGYCFNFGATSFSWSSKKQSVVALSTCEAEYVAAASSACQAIWLLNLMNQIYALMKEPMKIFVDNVSVIDLAKNPITHGRSKHIDVRFHFLRDQVGKKAIELVYCKSENQVADILAKPLKFEAFIKLRSMLGMTTLSNQD